MSGFREIVSDAIMAGAATRTQSEIEESTSEVQKRAHDWFVCSVTKGDRHF